MVRRHRAYLTIFCIFVPLIAGAAPVPPCAGAPTPPYASAGQGPVVQVWKSAELESWVPPACLLWSGPRPNLVVAIAGTTPKTHSAEDLLKTFGTVSALTNIRYWSVTDKSWRVLMSEASASADAKGLAPRVDFSADEMKHGQSLFFSQKDGRFGGTSIYRLRVRDFSGSHIVVEIDNVSPMKALILTIAKPGDMKFLYFLDRAADGLWSSYTMLIATSSYVERNEASFVNRTMAFYRHFTGLPTDSEPPAAP